MNIIELNFKFSELLSTRINTKYIILHHRAGYGDAASIHAQHINQGYAGIGYHFYVRSDGRVYKGRPINKIGAHCLNHNYNSIGVCFEGNFEKDVITDAQKNAGKELIQYLKGKYESAEVVRHKDLMATACPGEKFPFDEIKKGDISETELTSANDITWELSQRIKINDKEGFVKALDKAKKENSPLYWGYYKIVNGK